MLVLADLGIALIGTLIAALAVRTRARDLLGPLLALPLLVPVVIAGAAARRTSDGRARQRTRTEVAACTRHL